MNERPLRVLLLTQASGGGVGRHFLDLAQGLSARGVDVHGIYSPRKLDALCRGRLANESLPPMHSFPMRRGVHPLDALDSWKLVRQIRRLGKFDVIHGHSSKGGALARLAGRWLNIPSVYTPNAFVTVDPTLSSWERNFYGRIERWLARRTAAIIAVSHDELEHACELGIDRRILRLVPNAIGETRFPDREKVRERLGIGVHESVIGFVGRLAHQKAPEVMLAAFAKVGSQRSDVRLVMVGNGPLEAETRLCMERLGLQSRVLMLGDVVATDVMPAFDLFCLSSRYEGMPYVLLEALAAGLPIVATRVGGVTMTVEHETNGLIVPSDDDASLASALLRVVDDVPLRQRFAAASFAQARKFTLDEMVERTIALYRSVVREKQVL